MNQYEAMFLFDPTCGGSFENCESEIRRLMERADGEIVFCRKWDDRRLSYKSKGRTRGVYVLVYFPAPPEKISPMQRDVKISEPILRLLVTRADHVTPAMMERAVASPGAEFGADHGIAASPRKAVAQEGSEATTTGDKDETATQDTPTAVAEQVPQSRGPTAVVEATPE